MLPEDIAFLENLAQRLSNALYYEQVGPIGRNGTVSSGLLHDDYDRLRAIVKAEKITNLRAALAILEGTDENKSREA